MDDNERYYRDDLAYVHDQGFGFHAASCAPGLLSLLEPVRRRHGLVLEIGCGSGLLTRLLVQDGHRVIATDASLAMLRLACAVRAGTSGELTRWRVRHHLATDIDDWRPIRSQSDHGPDDGGLSLSASFLALRARSLGAAERDQEHHGWA